jgi:hypothetical protein
MAKIAEGALYRFKTGDIVDADVAPQGGALNPIFETIRVALNDTDTRVDNTYNKTEVDTKIAESQAGVVVSNSITNDKLAPDVKVGSLAALVTTDKSNVVAAINEAAQNAVDAYQKTGGQIFGDLTVYKNSPAVHITSSGDLAENSIAALKFEDLSEIPHWTIKTRAAESLGPTTLDFVNHDGITVASIDQNGYIKSNARSKVLDTTLTTTLESTIASYTPLAAANYFIGVYLRVVTGTTTVTVKITYADVTGAQTVILIDAQSTAVGSYSLLPFFCNAAAGTAINVKVTASVANQVKASATIMEV